MPPTPTTRALAAARRLATRLRDLPDLPDGVERPSVRTDITVHLAVYAATEVRYNEDPFGVGLTLARAIPEFGNPAGRIAAEVAAAPRWLPAGPVQACLADHHLALVGASVTRTVGLAALRQVRHRLSALRLELHANGHPPLALTGPWVPYLTVALVHRLSGRVLDPPTSVTPAPTAPPPPPPLRLRRRLEWLIG